MSKLSRSDQQLIRSLDKKRIREESGFFLVEGPKIVGELLQLPLGHPFRIEKLIGLPAWFEQQSGQISNHPVEMIHIAEAELRKISQNQHPSQVLAMVRLPKIESPLPALTTGLFLLLDGVQDPGNCGTIIRIADWFGLDGVISAAGSADFFNPKVIQATMGSFMRIPMFSLSEEFNEANFSPDLMVYGAVMNGDNLFTTEISSKGLIIMGNESRGISERWLNRLTKRITIPSYSSGSFQAESLNVATAAAIICSEFRRRAIG